MNRILNITICLWYVELNQIGNLINQKFQSTKENLVRIEEKLQRDLNG